MSIEQAVKRYLAIKEEKVAAAFWDVEQRLREIEARAPAYRELAVTVVEKIRTSLGLSETIEVPVMGAYGQYAGFMASLEGRVSGMLAASENVEPAGKPFVVGQRVVLADQTFADWASIKLGGVGVVKKLCVECEYQSSYVDFPDDGRYEIHISNISIRGLRERQRGEEVGPGICVGDEVEVRGSVFNGKCWYDVTQDGSKGRVNGRSRFGDGYIAVEFFDLPVRDPAIILPVTFDNIRPAHLVVTKRDGALNEREKQRIQLVVSTIRTEVEESGGLAAYMAERRALIQGGVGRLRAVGVPDGRIREFLAGRVTGGGHIAELLRS